MTEPISITSPPPKVNVDKVLTVIAFVFILTALIIIAITPPATGYEISIYDAYPSYFWFSIIAAISCGIGILIHQAFDKERSNWWFAGLRIIIFANLIIILLPIFRGYFISNLADGVSHLGMIKDIGLTGEIGNSNVYPISHILSYQLSSICGLDSRLVIKVIPSVFYLIYMAGLYLLAKEICRKFGQVLLVMTFGSVLLFTYFNYLFLPTQLFLCLVPLILFLFFRKNQSPNLSYATIFIISFLPMPFLHPLGSIFLVATFLLLALSILIRRFLTKRHGIEGKTASYSLGAALVPSSIVFIIFFMWFCNFAVFRSTVTQTYEWFVYGYGTPLVVTMAEQWQMASFTIPQFIDLLMRNYGHCLIFSFLSVVAIFVILRKVFSPRSSLTTGEIFFPLLFLVFGVFYISTLVGAFLMTGRSLRIFCWALMVSTVVNGIVFHEWLSKLKGKSTIICVGLLAIIIIITATVGVFSVYPSPHIKQANFQVTTMDWSGMEWFFDYKNADATMYFEQLPYRALGFIYGYDASKPEMVGSFYEVPERLGYNENESLADSLDSDSYIVISERVRAYKAQLWPDIGRYTLSDLNRISYDPGVNKIYSNGELDIYHVFAAEK